MNVAEYASIIVGELSLTLNKVSPEEGEKLSDMILAADKIFVAGAGRSGLAAKAFAMRLMHMGFDAFVVGETVTPNLAQEDLFIIASGSGETSSLIAMARKAKAIGALLATVTIRPNSSIGVLADLSVTIPAPTPKADVTVDFKSIQPMGSLFEQSLQLFFDAVILKLMEKRGIDSDTMFTRHANLE